MGNDKYCKECRSEIPYLYVNDEGEKSILTGSPHSPFKGVCLLEIEQTFTNRLFNKEEYPARWWHARESYCSLNCLLINHAELEEECKRSKERVHDTLAAMDALKTRLIVGSFIAFFIVLFIYKEFFEVYE
ncbi:hypothetical protein N8697_00730 [bacterium]|nr:hypothetical protein [bacterium]